MRKINIILADDDNDDREFFVSALQRFDFDYELTLLNNGQQVLNHFKQIETLPDYVFLDINMPFADGVECLSFIKKSFPEHQFPIIMLSTASSEEVINRCYSAGASIYIRKPSRFNDLLDILRFCVNELKNTPLHEPARFAKN